MPNNHCGRHSCMCSHTEGCDRGYINLEDAAGRDVGVTPCKQCKPELADIIQTSGDVETKRRLMDDLNEQRKARRFSHAS